MPPRSNSPICERSLDLTLIEIGRRDIPQCSPKHFFTQMFYRTFSGGQRPSADDLRAAGPAARNSGGCHRGKARGSLRLDARRSSPAVPVSFEVEDHPGMGRILERIDGAAFPRWANSTLRTFGQRTDHLRCPDENPV